MLARMAALARVKENFCSISRRGMVGCMVGCWDGGDGGGLAGGKCEICWSESPCTVIGMFEDWLCVADRSSAKSAVCCLKSK